MNYEKDGVLRQRSLARTSAFVLGGFLIAGSSIAFAAGAANAAPGDASVTVIHGIPDTPVDVYVNDPTAASAPLLADFQPGTVTDPLALPAGTYDVTIFAAGTKTDPVINQSETVEADQNISLIANLDAAGMPVLSAFLNDVSPIPVGQARLVVRHTAEAPAVDVRANENVVFADLTNGQQDSAELAPGTVSADVVLAGTSTVVIGPAPLTLTAGTETIVYAIGSATADPTTLGLVVQTISGLAAEPTPPPTTTPTPVPPAPVPPASVPGVSVNAGGVAQSSASVAPWLAGGFGLIGVISAVFAIGLYRRQRESA
ncbi:DUF4397 domain-containing protein [Glaciibacter psychrotolerans]|uniref:DUF4397 domain-containing protein n=1 Tax=Glaciibacter psychrotolerans TaxID=670054 RepID=A0A7Z0EBL0_9MICO|nr:DUF4397 domain-containing protein [Leifsonia psychrotolerans]NYJ18609.1 hypothetical protein [Leifsonia psychrotolerans]